MSQPPGWGGPPEQPAQPGWGQQPQWGEGPQWGQSPAGPQWGQAPGSPVPPVYQSWRPRPGIIPLRPISLGEIYDGAFQAIRTNPRTMLGFSAIVMVVVTAVSIVPQAFVYASFGDRLDPNRVPTTPGDDLSFLAATLEATLVPAAVQYLAVTILTALLVVAVSGAVLGQRMAPGPLWTRVRPRLWAVFGLGLLEGLAIAGIVVVSLVPGIALLALGSGDAAVAVLVLVLLVLAGVGFAVYVAIRWSLAGPALLLEDQRVAAALRRSWQLARGSWWRLFGIRVLTQIIVGIGTGIVGVPFSLVGGIFLNSGFQGSFGSTLLGLGIQGLGTIITGTVFLPFTAAVGALLYIDLRMRREGLDVQLMSATQEGHQA